MKLNNLIYMLIISFLMNNSAYAKWEYAYIDIGECTIPIMNTLELTSSDESTYVYSEKNHSFFKTMDSPTSIVIEKTVVNQKSIDNIIRVSKLKKKRLLGLFR